MARFITRIATLCRPRGDDEALLRRFRMMRLGGDGEVDAGPGWFESSRELQRGLQVSEGDALEDWLAAMHQPAAAPQAAA